MHDFEQSASSRLSFHTETFSGNGPFQMGKAIFKNKEDWLGYAEDIIRALNLECVLIENVPNGYRFGFTSLEQMLVFDFVAAGERQGRYRHIEHIPEPEYRPYWKRAVITHFNDKGIKAEINDAENGFEILMARKADFVSFHLAKNGIGHIASENFRSTLPDNKPPQI